MRIAETLCLTLTSLLQVFSWRQSELQCLVLVRGCGGGWLDAFQVQAGSWCCIYLHDNCFIVDFICITFCMLQLHNHYLYSPGVGWWLAIPLMVLCAQLKRYAAIWQSMVGNSLRYRTCRTGEFDFVMQMPMAEGQSA